jgi:hypothetical protein
VRRPPVPCTRVRRAPAEHLGTGGGYGAHLDEQKTTGPGALEAEERAPSNGGRGGENRDGWSGG